jgi:hypothetical protein
MTAVRSTSSSSRKAIGVGFLPDEARHGFLITVPKGNSSSDRIFITEHRWNSLGEFDNQPFGSQSLDDPALRVLIDRGRWLALAPGFWEEANQRLRANGLAAAKFLKNPSKPIPVHASLGKELCVLCWAVEEASPETIPNALRNWEALAPEERWWLYTMTVATTGQAMQTGIGWRKALRAAIADNLFVKGEGMSPRTRRELLGHSQLSLAL